MVAPTTSEQHAANLAAINAELRELGLAEFTDLGWWTKREDEYTELTGAHHHPGARLVDVTFAGIRANGKPSEFTFTYNANSAVTDGAVLIVRINGSRFVLVRQRRGAISKYLTEAPRAFPPQPGAPGAPQPGSLLHVDNVPVWCALDEIGEDIIRSARTKVSMHIGTIVENSGASAIQPDVWFFDIEADPAAIQRRHKIPTENGLEFQLWPIEKVVAQLSRQINDGHSVQAFLRYLTHYNLLHLFAVQPN